MCVARSTFYAWKKRQGRPCPQTELCEMIGHIWAQSRRQAGSRAIKGQLLQDYGVDVSRGKVQRLMRQMQIQGTQTTRRAKPPKSVMVDQDAQNLLARDFEVGVPNQRWCADITQWSTCEGVAVFGGDV